MILALLTINPKGEAIMSQTRFEDSPDLFGCGVGASTGFTEQCDWCGCIHNPDADDDDPSTEGDSVMWTDFAGKHVCYCCFAMIEEEIWHRRSHVIGWLLRRIMAIKKQLDRDCREARKASDLLDG